MENDTMMALLAALLLPKTDMSPDMITKWNQKACLADALPSEVDSIKVPYHGTFVSGKYAGLNVVILMDYAGNFRMGTDFWSQDELAAMIRDGILVSSGLGLLDYIEDSVRDRILSAHNAIYEYAHGPDNLSTFFSKFESVDSGVEFALALALNVVCVDWDNDLYTKLMTENQEIPPPLTIDLMAGLVAKNLKERTDSNGINKYVFQKDSTIERIAIFASAYLEYISRLNHSDEDELAEDEDLNLFSLRSFFDDDTE